MRRPVDRTGLQAFPIGLGGMPLSIDGRPSRKQAPAVIHAALGAVELERLTRLG